MTYLLGHDPAELERLEHQARMLSPATATVLRLAGIGPGMRVLDLGTGAGDVAFEVAELVGPTGAVVGIDQSETALAFATHRAAQRGLTNVTFVRDDLTTATITDTFDAVVGRLVLLYLPEPEAVLRRLASTVKIVAMMEYEMAAAGTLPATKLGDQVNYWITESFGRAGLDPSLGARLDQLMKKAGVNGATTLGLQGYSPPGDRSGPRMAAGIIRTLLPVLEKTGVATADEVDVDTLEERLAKENAIVKFPTLVGSWARVA